MRINNKLFYGLALGTVMGGIFASCSNDLSEPTYNKLPNSGQVSLVKAPDFVAWSGEEVLGSTLDGKWTNAVVATRATDMEWNHYFKCQDYENNYYWSDWAIENYPELYAAKDNFPPKTDRGEYVSQNEFNYVMQYIAEHPDEGGYTCNLSTYFIQNVGTSGDLYHEGFIASDGSVHHYADIVGGNQMDYLVIGGKHINDYNATYGPRALVVDNPITPEISYHDSYGTQNTTKDQAYKFYYITLPNDPDLYGDQAGKTQCYLCFDYQTKKWDNGDLDYNGDGVYNDWVIKIVPADGSEPRIPDDYNDGEETPPTPPVTDPTDPEDPDDPNTDVTEEPVIHNNEVEVNYEIVDSHDYPSGIADLVTKLSIHVRHTTDVDIRIPVPNRYIIESDDLYIFNEHFGIEGEYHGTYGGSLDELLGENTFQSISYNVAGNTVTLNVEFVYNEQGGYIRVYTTGINQAVMDYCFEHNGDGINFEIWNYYQTEKKNAAGDIVAASDLTREMLKGFLDGSTITFTDNPDYYINAFGWDWYDDVDYSDGQNSDYHKDTINPDDCYVRPTSSEYGSPTRTEHLNGTPYNDIYVLNGVTPDHEHTYR